jgi:hypothetical protein
LLKGFSNEDVVREMLNTPPHPPVLCLLEWDYGREKLNIAAKLAHFMKLGKQMKKAVSLEKYDKRFSALSCRNPKKHSQEEQQHPNLPHRQTVFLPHTTTH